MAVALVALQNQDVRGKFKSRIVEATIASYTTGGEDLTAAAAGQGIRDLQGIVCLDAMSSNQYVPFYVRTTRKLFFGRGDNDNVADGPLVEAGSTNNVGTIKLELYGN